MLGDALKVQVRAPPVDGKANKQLIQFIAKQFGVAQSAVSITSGELGRQKNLLIESPTKLPESLGIADTNTTL